MRSGVRFVIVAAVVVASAVVLLAAGAPSGTRDAYACSGPDSVPSSIWCVPFGR